MPYTETARPLGDEKLYKVSDEVKRYTLRDVGFIETKQGNFQFVRSLNPTPQMETGLTLKLTIDQSMTQLKMSIVGQNGMRAVNIFTDHSEKGKMIQEKYRFYMNGLLQRHCIEEVTESI